MKYKLKYHGLSGHGNINTQSRSVRTISRRVLAVQRVVDTLDGCVNDFINLREKCLLNEFTKNRHVFHVIKPRIEKIWIREQSILMKNANLQEDWALQIALTGVISHWTQRQWNDFNRSVCTLI